MQRDITVAGRVRRIELSKEGDRHLVTVDGRPWPVSAVRVDGHTISLLFGPDSTGGTSYEVTLAPDRATGGRTAHIRASVLPISLNDRLGRSRKDDDGLSTASGTQRVVAAMPGRVVRVLVKTGDHVRAGQGLVVIEAMKMENELRARRDGRVADVRVREAMTVDGGALLLTIE